MPTRQVLAFLLLGLFPGVAVRAGEEPKKKEREQLTGGHRDRRPYNNRLQARSRPW